MDLTIRQGETLQIPIESSDVSAETVQFQAAKDGVIYIDETAQFVNGKATIWTNNTDIQIGVYEWMLTVTYSDGLIDKLPDQNDCEEDDCKLPTLTVCKGDLTEVIS